MRRTTLFAAFHEGKPTPCYSFTRRVAQRSLDARVANGSAFPREQIQQVTITFYITQLKRHGIGVPDALLPWTS